MRCVNVSRRLNSCRVDLAAILWIAAQATGLRRPVQQVKNLATPPELT